MLIRTANHIPRSERITNTVFALLLFAYGSYGVWINDLYIPGKRSNGIHLQDVPAWIMYGALVSASVVLLSIVVDHYDRRNNERHYRTFASVGKFFGWGLFGLSLAWHIFQ